MSQFVFSRQFYNDEVGRTYPYARLYFYDTNTFNFKDVYADVERTVPAPNPVIADGSGRFPPLYLDNGSDYRVWLKDRFDVQVTPFVDNYGFSSSGLGTAAYVDTGTDSDEIPLNSNLGTAAYVDTTSSNLDNTPGKVLKVQDAGILLPLVPQDWGTLSENINSYVSSNGGGPLGGGATATFGLQSSNGGGYSTRFTGRDGRFWVSSVEGSVIGAWLEIWHAGNTTVDINGFIKEL